MKILKTTEKSEGSFPTKQKTMSLADEKGHQPQQHQLTRDATIQVRRCLTATDGKEYLSILCKGKYSTSIQYSEIIPFLKINVLPSQCAVDVKKKVLSDLLSRQNFTIPRAYGS